MKEEEKPRLALLNLMLSDTDGTELTQAILSVAEVLVIFLSAYGREDLIARAFDTGAWTAWSSSSRLRSLQPASGWRRREVAEPLKP